MKTKKLHRDIKKAIKKFKDQNQWLDCDERMKPFYKLNKRLNVRS